MLTTTTTSSTILLTRRRTRKMFKLVSVLESTLSSMSVPVPRGNLPTMIERGLYCLRLCVGWKLLPPIVSFFTSLCISVHICASRLPLADFPAVFFHISHWYLPWNTHNWQIQVTRVSWVGQSTKLPPHLLQTKKARVSAWSWSRPWKATASSAHLDNYHC